MNTRRKLLFFGKRGGAFDPASLFLPGNQGFYYSTEPQYLFQDAAGTIPVTTDGDPVGLQIDLSGNNNHATQATGAGRLVYHTENGLHWLEADGVDDHLDVPVIAAGAAGSDNTAVIGVRQNGGANPYVLGDRDDNGFNMLFRFDRGFIRPYVSTTAGGFGDIGTTAFISTPFIYSQDWERSAGRLRGFANGIEEVNIAGTPADKTIPSSFTLAARGGASPFLYGRLYDRFLIDRKLSQADRQELESFIAQKAGVIL